MQDFRDSEKINKIKWPTGSHFGFLCVKFVMGYPCVRHNILFYIHGTSSHFAFLELSEYYKIQNGR